MSSADRLPVEGETPPLFIQARQEPRRSTTALGRLLIDRGFASEAQMVEWERQARDGVRERFRSDPR